MRLYEAKRIIADKPDSEDVSVRFGAIKGTVTACQLRRLTEGHHDNESVQPESNGEGVWMTDWTHTKMGVFSPFL